MKGQWEAQLFFWVLTRTWLKVSKVNETKIKTKQTNKKQNETKLGKLPSGYLVTKSRGKGLEIWSVQHAKSILILFWNVQSCVFTGPFQTWITADETR